MPAAQKDMDFVKNQLAELRASSLKAGFISEQSADGLTQEQLSNVTGNPENLGNDAAIEVHWAMKAARHAETYFNLLKAFPDKNRLKLTKLDDEIYLEFRRHFPKKKVGDLKKLDLNLLKDEESKKKWRKFIVSYKEFVKDYNFGTLIRIDAGLDYSEENSEIVTRIEFVAIELARNREGVNNGI